jgi:hypothetical protein
MPSSTSQRRQGIARRALPCRSPPAKQCLRITRGMSTGVSLADRP